MTESKAAAEESNKRREMDDICFGPQVETHRDAPHRSQPVITGDISIDHPELGGQPSIALVESRRRSGLRGRIIGY